ncbi:MAG: MFS transporter [Rhodobacteraceae bacterium]|nr:MFS transporter [Paracoccaceae bacterium]
MAETPIYRAGLVLAIWGAGLGAAAQFGKISVIFDRLAAHYAGAAGSAGMGFMVSVVGIVGLLFGTTAGLMVQRLGLRRVLVGGLALGAALSAAEALLPPYPAMMGLRALEGVSQLAIVVAGPVLIAQTATLRWQGLAMSLWASFFGVSFALTALVAPVLVAAFGVPGLFLGHALWLAAFAVILWAMLPPDPPGTAAPLRLVDLPGLHAAIYRSPRVAAPALGFVFYTLTYVAVLTLLPPLAGAERAGIAVTMPLVSIAASLTLGVWLMRYMPAVRLVQAGFALGLVAVAVMVPFWGTPPGFAATLVLGAALGLVQGASFASIPQLNASAEDRARASGAVAQLGNLGTASGTPILAAMIAQGGIGGVFWFVAPLCVGGIAAHGWMALRRRG